MQASRLPYDGDDPHGFMLRDDIVAYVERYARSFNAPLREGVNVQRVVKRDGGFTLFTSLGELQADQVVVAVGELPSPALSGACRPASRAHRADPFRALQIRAAAAGREVLVVGLRRSPARKSPKIYTSRDARCIYASAARRGWRVFIVAATWWTGLKIWATYRLTVEDHPQGEEARRKTNHYVTGRDGGRDIDLRAFALQGMRLHGRLLAYADGKLHTADDLRANLDGADATAQKN
ncbi:NAD(P)-binding domain-containing protein [Klebsiella variicola subsp. variicola]|nr:NAD(P)-binding domain-containing protein [Klebsiella variicola subsp. variicola]